MTPVRIRGVTYPSAASAARALGVAAKTIYKHLDAGTPDLIGLLSKDRSRSCRLDGVDYSSLTEAARALGVAVSTVYNRVERQKRRGAAV